MSHEHLVPVEDRLEVLDVPELFGDRDVEAAEQVHVDDQRVVASAIHREAVVLAATRMGFDHSELTRVSAHQGTCDVPGQRALERIRQFDWLVVPFPPKADRSWAGHQQFTYRTGLLLPGGNRSRTLRLR